MAILLADTVWEGNSVALEPKPTFAEGARDGHFFKELDTGETYHRQNGSWEYINLGLSFIKATKSSSVTTDANGDASVTFATPLADNNYIVTFGVNDDTSPFVVGIVSKSITGFSLKTRQSQNGNPEGNVEVSWLVTRDYNP